MIDVLAALEATEREGGRPAEDDEEARRVRAVFLPLPHNECQHFFHPRTKPIAISKSSPPACHGTRRSSDCCTDFVLFRVDNTDSSSDSQRSERPFSILVLVDWAMLPSFLALVCLLFWYVCLPLALPWLCALDNKGAALCETCLRLCLVIGPRDDEDLSCSHHASNQAVARPCLGPSPSCRISCALGEAPTTTHTPPHAPNTPCPTRLVLALPVSRLANDASPWIFCLWLCVRA